ncbi:MAG TPA: histidine kinase [Cyanobacteria bacterium UBA12227]|nr:histidine kinase [Cyanobacteria bacterium UBA12227]HAX90051.1 histidine kinase [Cyanobacteria bacterium UBA11370]HBY80503.1 histidine kinase [Cyanobacteria bacterium UBA11148]
MDAGNQRILGYFIEEAKEHLDTLEKGLLNLREVVKEPETVNEMFRAAHSVKGGAAMLGFSSLQKTAHRLEDGLKLLKENEIEVDRNLETLFLRGYDTLRDLIEQLQGPFGLREDEAETVMQAAEPNFVELQHYLERLVSGGKAPTATPPTSVEPAKTQSKPPSNFSPQVMGILKQMLQLFKQPDSPASRQKLQEYCKRLVQLGQGIEPWQGLVHLTTQAIANSKNSYQTLAPIVIKELKQASDQVQQGKASAIATSPTLQKLVTPPTKPATATPPTTTTPAQDTTANQITIPVEPKAAAKALIQAFDKNQLSQLAKLLVQAVRASS